MTSPGAPRGLTQQTANRTADPSDLRSGTVVAVTPRGVDVQVADGLVAGAAHLGSYAPAVGDPVSLVRFADSWLVLGRPIGPGTATDLLSPSPMMGLSILGGMGLGGGGTTLASSTGAVVAVPKYAAIYYHPPGHWVGLWATYTWYCNTLNDTLQMALKDSVTGQQWSAEHIQAGNVLFSNFATELFAVPPTLSGRRASYTMTVQRISGTGTVRIDDGGTRRGSLLAVDLGDGSFIPTA